MACKRSSVRPRYSPLLAVAAMLHHAEEIFDILTHETVESKLKNRDTGMYISIYMLVVRAESMRFDCD